MRVSSSNFEALVWVYGASVWSFPFQGSSGVWMGASASRRNTTATGPSSAWMGRTSGTAGSPLRTALCAVTTRPAVSPRAGYVMATWTVLTKKMNKDVVSAMKLPGSVLNYFSWFSLFLVVKSYEIAMNIELVDIKSLLLEKIQGEVSASLWARVC